MDSLADISSVHAFATALSVATGAYALGKLFSGRLAQGRLANLASQTRDLTSASWDSEEMEKLCGDAPSKDELELLELPLSAIAERLRARSITSERLVQVVFHAARAVHKAINCCTEHCLKSALEEAREADRRLDAGEGVGELTGIPISVKDCFDQRGCLATCGTAVRSAARCVEDGPLVAALRDAGAIPLVRTNVPQSLMVPESQNNIWGCTSNPWNGQRSPGGSSGGEGALVAARGSLLGLGTDIGGSIRIPAHFCGVAGFKPTPQRITRSGLTIPRRGGVNGQEAILSAAGPIGRCVADLVPVTRLWLSESVYQRDPLAPLSPWDAKAFEKKGPFRIGVFASDPYFPASQPCQRAVQEAADALRAAGHDVVPVAVPSLRRVVTTFCRIMGADGGMRSFREGLDGEALHPLYNTLSRIASLPRFTRPLIAAVLGAVGEHRLAELMRLGRGRSAYEYWACVADRMRYQKEFARVWQEAGLDAMLVPGGSTPAFRHGDSAQLTISLAYTMLANLLHYPAGTVPVTSVQEGEEDYGAVSGPRDRPFRLASEVLRGSRGLPVGVQVMTMQSRDELCLRVMLELEQALGGPFAARPGVCYSQGQV